jgi:hypothetical protein
MFIVSRDKEAVIAGLCLAIQEQSTTAALQISMLLIFNTVFLHYTIEDGSLVYIH